MKKILLYLALVLFLVQSGCKNSATDLKGEVKVIDVRSTGEPNTVLAAHKARDVEVFRIVFMDSSCYSVRYYQLEKDSLRSHKAYIVHHDDFDKAAYSWVNDTTVAVQLINTSTNNQKSIELFGYGRASGMKVE